VLTVLLTATALVTLRPVTKRSASPIGLMADVGGPMRLVVCSVNSARRSALRNAPLVSQIISVLPPNVHVLLLVNDRGAFRVAANPWPDRVSFVELPEDVPITIWPQDPFVVLSPKGGSVELLVSNHFERASDVQMAVAIASHLGWQYKKSTLSFEGGNIVSDGELVFVGADTIRYNTVHLGQPEHEVVEEFERQFGRTLYVVDRVPQVVAHIDLILTPLGGRVVALADSRWGARLAEQALAEDPGGVAAFERYCERMFLGHEDIAQVRNVEGGTIRSPTIVGRTSEAVAASLAIAPQLDRIAEEIRAAGYDVVRLPFLFPGPLITASAATSEESASGNFENGEEATGHDPDVDPPPAQPGYPYLSYNNVLLETNDGNDTVYLPQYGWPLFDDVARSTWQSNGFAVRAVPGFTTSAMYLGSLRCCVKVLSREHDYD